MSQRDQLRLFGLAMRQAAIVGDAVHNPLWTRRAAQANPALFPSRGGEPTTASSTGMRLVSLARTVVREVAGAKGNQDGTHGTA